MSSKFLLIHMLLATLSAVQLKADGPLPVIHFISEMIGNVDSPQISIRIKLADGSLKGSAQLSARQSYQIKVDLNGVYHTIAVFGLKFVSFHAYESARDKGRADVYWKADKDGFAISYDQITWKNMAPWESE